ncbi:hypothetical protein [Paraburkholderia agricolaris]|uniref:hypothetical protein n=1 Tax=Paraburkholderia agricolaris TaxID=2152888 RepID=UPI001292AE8E|nr:hypothetical protein [Paraburkholderia agricolaris]
MIPTTLAERLERLRADASGLRAYALVDGLQYEQHFGRSFRTTAPLVNTELKPL